MPRDAEQVGDPLALVDLLWSSSTRVSRSGVTVGGIVSEAIAVADADGLSAVTMRAVAARVGVAPMTLYGYLPGKPELLELMIDAVTGATYAGHPAPADNPDWASALRWIATRVFDQGLAHPWSLELPTTRPVLGPGVCTVYEQELTPLDGIGLDDLEMDQVLSAVRSLAASAARWQASLDAARSRSGLSDEQWWQTVGPRLAEVMPPGAFPLASRIGDSVSSAGEPRAMLDTALDAIIDGLRTRLEPQR